jgi:hypothetical protein
LRAACSPPTIIMGRRTCLPNAPHQPRPQVVG